MRIPSWLRPLAGRLMRNPAPTASRTASRPRLGVEQLEDRSVPAAGYLDPTFGTGGQVLTDFGPNNNDNARAVAVLSDGKILVGGHTYNPATGMDFAVARYHPNGSLDTSFGSGGRTTIHFNGSGDYLDEELSELAVQSDGKIVLVGTTRRGPNDYDFAVARLNANGSLDTSFGTGGRVVLNFSPPAAVDEARGVVVQPDGKIVLGGRTFGIHGYDFAAARLNANGSLDTSFGTGGLATVDFGGDQGATDVALQSDGKIVLVGGTAGGPTTNVMAAARLNGDGSLDTSFDSDGRATVAFGEGSTTGAHGVVVQPDGKIVLVGSTPTAASSVSAAAARLNANGSLDTSFSSDGKVTIDDGRQAQDVVVQPDGKIVLVGTGSTVLRLNADGNLDNSFGVMGHANIGSGIGHAEGVALQSDGKIVVAASSFFSYDGTGNNFSVARFDGGNTPPTAGVSGPAAGVRGQSLTFTLTATDPTSPNSFTFAIDWDGNGTTDQTVTGPSGTTVPHTYPATGTYTVRVTATDQGNLTSAPAQTAVTVNVAMLQTDDCNPGQYALFVGGTTGNDDITLSPSGSSVEVKIGGTVVGTFAPTGRIVVYGQAGNDDIQVAGGITLSAWLYGDAGDDRLKGGAGNDVLLGGSGADLIVGGAGRDLLIGGAGADRIVGNADDDILLAGLFLFESDPSKLCAVMKEWTRTDKTAAERVSNLQNGGGLNGSVVLSAATVSSDTDADVLTGSSGSDWFLFDSTRDRVTDLSDGAFSNDLPFING